ncbi:MAG: hypothetical protein HZB44_10090 [Actinobacteria bacterium]|nr:hypothetical protein [Actinomycetota bacterium]
MKQDLRRQAQKVSWDFSVPENAGDSHAGSPPEILANSAENLFTPPDAIAVVKILD